MKKLQRRELIGGMLGVVAGFPVLAETRDTVQPPGTITGAQLILALKLWWDLRYIDGWVQVEGRLHDAEPPTVSVRVESAEWDDDEEFHQFFFSPEVSVAIVARAFPASVLPYLDAPFRHCTGYDCKTFDFEEIEYLAGFLVEHEEGFRCTLVDLGSVRDRLGASNPGLCALLEAVASGTITEEMLR